jgi:hypothetical protein
MALRDPRVRVILAEAYKAALASKIEILAIFTAGVTFQHNYRTQLLDAFPDIAFGGQLQLEYFERCDHNFTFEIHRACLFRITAEWLSCATFNRASSRDAADEQVPDDQVPDDQVVVEF